MNILQNKRNQLVFIVGLVFIVVLFVLVQVQKHFSKSVSPRKGVSSKIAKRKETIIHTLPRTQIFLNDPDKKDLLILTVSLKLSPPQAVKEIKKLNAQTFLSEIVEKKSLEDIDDAAGRIQLRNEMKEKFNKILRRGRVLTIYFTEFILRKKKKIGKEKSEIKSLLSPLA